MKIALIGDTGTIGKAIVNELSDHEVIAVGRSDGDYQVDLEDDASITALFQQTGKVDVVISTVGPVVFAPVADITKEQFQFAFDGKVQSNLNLFRIAKDHIKEGGSFTVTSGALANNRCRGPPQSAPSTHRRVLSPGQRRALFDLPADEISTKLRRRSCQGYREGSWLGCD